MTRRFILAVVLILAAGAVLMYSRQTVQDEVFTAPDSLIEAERYLEQKEYSRAEPLLRKALGGRLTPRDEARAHYALAGVFANTRRLDAASEHLRRSLEADAGFVPGDGRSVREVLEKVDRRRGQEGVARIRPPDPISGLAWKVMFVVGALFIGAMITALLAVGFKMLPKMAFSHSAGEFSGASLITVVSFENKQARITRDDPDFQKIIGQFIDKKQNPDYQVATQKMYIKTGIRTLAIEVSPVGWNFKGEPRNCRRLENGMELNDLIDKRLGY